MSSGRRQDRPQTVPSEKRETVVKRLKPLWLCGLGGGAGGLEPPNLVRVKHALQPAELSAQMIGFPGGYVVFRLTLSSRFYQLVAILRQLRQVFLQLD
jgi:hypothetical protein